MSVRLPDIKKKKKKTPTVEKGVGFAPESPELQAEREIVEAPGYFKKREKNLNSIEIDLPIDIGLFSREIKEQ